MGTMVEGSMTNSIVPDVAGAPRRRYLNVGLLTCLSVVGIISLLIDGPAFFRGHPAHSLIIPGGDVAEQVWFLAWLPHALLHGLNPFLSQQLFAGSGGVNLMVNTSVFAPALFLAPITLLGGPTLAFNVGVVLTPVVAAWPTYVLARRFTQSITLATFAVLLFVFSPYVLSNLAFGHFHQTVSFFPPVVALLGMDLVTKKRSARRIGVLGALAVIAQYFTGSELLAMTAVEVGIGLLVVAVLRPRLLIEVWRRAAIALLWTAGISAVVLAYPLWMEFFGPRHTTGSPWGGPFTFGGPLSGFVSSPIGLGHGDRITALTHVLDSRGVPLSFLGWGMVLSIIVFTIWLRKDRRVLALSSAAVISALLSLGISIRLTTNSNDLSSWAPWRLIYHLPIFEQLIPSRFIQMVTLPAVLVCLLGWERLRLVIASTERKSLLAVLVGAVAVVLVPQVLAAPVPFPSSPTQIGSAWFARYGANAPPNSRVLIFPYIDSGFGPGSAPMTWQATSNFSYAIVGGYVLVPTTGSTASAWRVNPTGSEGALQSLMTSFAVKKLTPAQRAGIAQAVIDRKVTTVVLMPIIGNNNLAEAELTAALGLRPRITSNGWLIWRRLQQVHPLSLPNKVIEDCAIPGPSKFPRDVVSCVLKAAGVQAKSSGSPTKPVH